MFTSGPPALSGTATLRLTRAARQGFNGRAGPAPTGPELRTYLTDLVRPHGLPLREDLLAAGAGRDYGGMAAALIAATVPPEEPVDVFMLAVAVSDARPGRATATYLSHVCPGDPLAFTVCDQGAVAGFTGLMLADVYARTGGSRRSLLVVAEQSVLHYRPARPVALPSRDAAVALLLEQDVPGAGPSASGGATVREVRRRADVAPDALAGCLRRELADIAPDTLLLGEGLAAYASGLRDAARTVRVHPAGQPSTGIWWDLVDELKRPGARVVAVADHDPHVRSLCLATLTVGG
jgi:4-hydroxymandelate oxidase